MDFRQFDDCLLQLTIDGGTTWTTIYDGSICVKSLGGGTPQGTQYGPPVPSSCINYQLAIPANGTIALPVTVNAGDTISIVAGPTNVWSDDVFGLITATSAFCGDGTQWQGPITGCATGEPAHEGDPLMTANHMEIIIAINGSYYRFLGGTLTVPAGVVNATLYFLPNDGVLSDNVGYQFIEVEHCASANVFHLADSRVAGATITKIGLTKWHVEQTNVDCDGSCVGSFCSSIRLLDQTDTCHPAKWIMSNQTGWSAYGCAGHSGGIADCAGSYIALFNSANLSGDSGWQDYFNANYQTTQVGLIDFRSATAFSYDIEATAIY